MIMENINDIKKEDLVSHEKLVEAFKAYLKREFFYDESEASIAASDLDNPYDTPYIMQDYEGIVTVDGVDYEVRSCYTDFCACGLFHLTDAPAFKFYMLFDQSTLSDSTVGAYQKARKVYVL